MKSLSLIFGAVATTIGLACASSLALKAGQDYCSLKPPPNPFISGNISAAENHREFCVIANALSAFNPLYSYEPQSPPAQQTLPNVTIGPYSIDPYLGIPGS